MPNSNIDSDDLPQIARLARQKAGMSIEEAADFLGVAHATIINAETLPEPEYRSVQLEMIARFGGWEVGDNYSTAAAPYSRIEWRGSVLPRSLGEQEKQPLAAAKNLLSETVAYGAEVLDQYVETVVDKEWQVPTALLLRHVLELTDATALMLGSGSLQPTRLLTRSKFEAWLGIMWIADSDSERRSYAYMVCKAIGDRDLYDRLDRNTEKGKNLASRLKGTLMEDLDISEQFDFDAARRRKDSLFDKSGYREAKAEHDRWRKAHRRKRPPWYALYGGPESLEGLAHVLSASDFYEFMYRKWSSYAHALSSISDGLVSLGPAASDVAGFLRLRQTADFSETTFFASAIARMVIRCVVTTWLPDREHEYHDFLRQIKLRYPAYTSR